MLVKILNVHCYMELLTTVGVRLDNEKYVYINLVLFLNLSLLSQYCFSEKK